MTDMDQIFHDGTIIVMDKAELFFETFQKWLTTQSAVRAACLVGSYARDAARPGSDIDIVLLVEEPYIFLNQQEWLKYFGDVQSVDMEDWGLLQAIRTFYVNGLEVEFGITTQEWAHDEITKKIARDGMKILYDPQDILKDVVT